MRKLHLLSVFLFFAAISCYGQDANIQFWNSLKKLCGNAYEGTMVEGAANDTFRGKKLVMHVRVCADNTIRIPFFVGDDKSRT